MRFGHSNGMLSWFSSTHLPQLSLPFLSTSSFVFWSSVVVPVGALRLLVVVFLLSACCAVCSCRGGCSRGVGMLCRRGLCLLSLLFASSPQGASAHVLHAVLFLSLCPLASCPVTVDARTLACLCATCARARCCCECGGWPLIVSFRSAARVAQTPDLLCCCFPLPFCCLIMAPKRGERRAAERADREALERRVRQRLDDVEQRIEEAEAMNRNHDQRISFQESPQRLVLRGFACVGEFFRTRGEDFPLAKRAFIGAFFQELKEHCGPEVTHQIEEAEGLLADRNGWGVVGVYPTGGSLDESPDGLLRLQPGFVGNRSGYLLCSSALYLQRPRQLFQDRVRRIDAKGKGKGKGKKGGKGNGKGKDKGPQPKRAAAPNGGAA